MAFLSHLRPNNNSKKPITKRKTSSGINVTKATPRVPTITLEVLRFVIGFLLLLFGLKWLKDAIQRYTGLKRKRDEEAVFLSNVDTAPARPSPEESIDSFGVLLAFKGVLLEGLEGAFVAISFAGGGM